MIVDRTKSLNDLAFEGRNKAYGAYYLRKMYTRYLGLSLGLGIIVLLLVVLLPFFYYYFEPVPLIEGDIMYDVEYYGMIPPPDEELNRMVQALSRPVQEVEQTPVVTDSVKPDESKPREILTEHEEIKEDQNKIDSLTKPGGSILGTGTGDDTGLATIIDVYPRFPGGDEARLYYLRQHVRYPEIALRGKIQGVVLVLFIIETDGSVSNVDVSKRIGGGCDEEAIRVTKEMPRWEPGKRTGRAVRVMVRMPIVFRMPGKPT
ncbi:MAG: TonB family protein [Bacteroidales bacterium]|jgi:protein TonB|nr:TonB family protein [Bacteroidales bacterium]